MTIINEYRVRREIIRVTRIVANQGLIRSSNGNISVRLREDRLFKSLPAACIKWPWRLMIPSL
jgi:hypothetical protein